MAASRKKPEQKSHHQRGQERGPGGRIGRVHEIVAAEKEHQGERHGRHQVIHQLVRHPRDQEKADHIDRLDEILLDLAVANLPGNAAGEARHAGECPRHHRQQVVGDKLLVAIAGELRFPRGLEDGPPQKNLCDDRQKPHQRAQGEVGPIDQPLFDADAEDGPPGRRHEAKVGVRRTASVDIAMLRPITLIRPGMDRRNRPHRTARSAGGSMSVPRSVQNGNCRQVLPTIAQILTQCHVAAEDVCERGCRGEALSVRRDLPQLRRLRN